MIKNDHMVNIGLDEHECPGPHPGNTAADLGNNITDANGRKLQMAFWEFGPSQSGGNSPDPGTQKYLQQVLGLAKQGRAAGETAWIRELNGQTPNTFNDLVASPNGALGPFGSWLKKNGYAK